MLNLSRNQRLMIAAVLLLMILPVIGYSISINKFEITKGLVDTLNLSKKNEVWGDFGSFISGVYGSIFSFLSLIAVLISLYLTQKNNAEQISILRNEQYTNEFLILLDTLKKLIVDKIYSVPYGPQTFGNFSGLVYSHISNMIYEDQGMTKNDIDIYALDFANRVLKTRGSKNLENEAPLMSEIIQKINIANESQSLVYKAILKSQLSNDIIFLLCAQLYMQGRDRNRIDSTKNLFETPAALKHMALEALANRTLANRN